MEELTEYEKRVIEDFKGLLKKTLLRHCISFEECGEEVIRIVKENDKWLFFVNIRGQREYLNEFDDVYDAIMGIFNFFAFPSEEVCAILDYFPAKKYFKEEQK